jgi:uncharacterized SAM-binding protein YcdF (DUF218 family)
MPDEKNNVDALVQILWDYHHLNHELRPADAIIVLGSNDLRVADRAAELFLANFAPIIVCTGGRGRLTENWETTEAEALTERLIAAGIPADNILVEPTATNTGENITRSRQLLADHGIVPRSIIAVQKPYMDRRSYATFKKVWPEVEVMVTSPHIAWADYCTGDMQKEYVINAMVGDLQRIKTYGENGFQIPQEIPTEVWQAYEELIRLGYDKQLIK